MMIINPALAAFNFLLLSFYSGNFFPGTKLVALVCFPPNQIASLCTPMMK
jgi:hypothetical protein